jgi:hypothetical protein
VNRPFAGQVPTLWSGSGITGEVLQRIIGARDAVVIADRHVPAANALATCCRSIQLDSSQLNLDTVVDLASELSRSRPEIVIAVGGGTIVDAAKIAALGARSGNAFTYLVEHAVRSGLTILPPGEPTTDVIAIPTTVGTSSETNSVGILKTLDGYRLIVGRSLRPRYAIIDSDNLMSLPDSALRAGAFEALLRVAGISTSSRGTARSRQDAVSIGQALIEAAQSDLGSPATRLRIARLSAATQRSGALRGRNPYAARHWYVANEVAFSLAVPKMVATAAIVSAIWGRVCMGDQRWGVRESLEGFWRAVTEGTTSSPDPVEGIESLIETWGLQRPPRPSELRIHAIALATEIAWGNRHPMLRGIGELDVREILEESLWDADGPGQQSGRSLLVIEGVNT